MRQKSASLSVRPIVASDRDDWQRLWTGYLEFYDSTVPPEVYEKTFERLLDNDPMTPMGLIAQLDNEAVGLVHYFLHYHAWKVEKVCYLQDLFTLPAARGHGVGRALIEAVYEKADHLGAPNVYWTTQDFNKTARKLYDRVGKLSPFIKYVRE